MTADKGARRGIAFELNDAIAKLKKARDAINRGEGWYWHKVRATVPMVIKDLERIDRKVDRIQRGE